MTDPLPDKPLAYNTTPRPRPRKWFRPPSQLEGYYSPFWPLAIVFFAFIVLLVYEISFLRHRAVILNVQILKLSDTLQKANAQNTFIQGVRSDLETLAPTHPAAETVLKEFFSTSAIPSPSEPDDTSKTPDTAAPIPAK